MKLTIDRKTNELVIRLALQKPTLAQSGRSLIVAKTDRFEQGDAVVDGKAVSVIATAFIPLDKARK
jgi:hypothetical protein